MQKLYWQRPVQRMRVFVGQSYILSILMMLKLPPVLVLLLIYQQYWFPGWKIAQTNSSGACLRSIKYMSFLGYRLGSFWRRWFEPYSARTNCCLSLRLKQLFFVIHHIFWIVCSQFIFVFQCNSSCRTGSFTIATEDAT